jgi:hypothetical protein
VVRGRTKQVERVTLAPLQSAVLETVAEHNPTIKKKMVGSIYI